MEEKKETRGGFRPNSGRKALEDGKRDKIINVYFTQKEKDSIVCYAKENKINISEKCREFLKELAGVK